MRIYLDTCAYNRPFDKSEELKVVLEAKCILFIQLFVAVGFLDLVTSYMLLYECEENPYKDKRLAIQNYIVKNSKCYVGIDLQKEVENSATEIMQSGIRFKDACHVAAAKIANADFFITTDKKLLKYQDNNIKILSPIEFLG